MYGQTLRIDGKLAVQTIDSLSLTPIFHFMPTTFATLSDNPTMDRAGFRFGPRGTQGSRTIMLRELTELFAALPP